METDDSRVDGPLTDGEIDQAVARLKDEFANTRELYREVCLLLFFRAGVTPTANRLYQLVRRGSMSTPVAVLNDFWKDLRERSRVQIGHPDMPTALASFLGTLGAEAWKLANLSAQESLAALRADVEASREAYRQETGQPAMRQHDWKPRLPDARRRFGLRRSRRTTCSGS